MSFVLRFSGRASYRIVTAVVLVVAHHGVDDAARVVALEVVFAAGDVAARRRLVRSVLAVLRAVAVPAARNAHARSEG